MSTPSWENSYENWINWIFDGYKNTSVNQREFRELTRENTLELPWSSFWRKHCLWANMNASLTNGCFIMLCFNGTRFFPGPKKPVQSGPRTWGTTVDLFANIPIHRTRTPPPPNQLYPTAPWYLLYTKETHHSVCCPWSSEHAHFSPSEKNDSRFGPGLPAGQLLKTNKVQNTWM